MNYSIWNHEIKIPNTNFTLKGHSRAAERTAFFIPQLNLFLDAGIQSPFDPEFIFVTHTHSDHVFALPMIITNIKNSPSIFVHKKMATLVDNFIMATYKLTMGSEDESKIERNYTIFPIEDSASFLIIAKKNRIIIETFKLKHTIPTLGYGFSFEKSKLREEFKDKSSKEIIELRKSGVQVTENIFQHFLCYLLDTDISALSEERIFKYQTIIIECTFIREEHQPQANETKHINWVQLLPFVKRYPDILFVLCHFSLRYKDEEIASFFEEQKKVNDIRNIYVWLN